MIFSEESGAGARPSEDSWGLRRERRRRRRTAIIMVLIGAASAVAGIVLQIAANGHGVFDHQPSHLAPGVPAWARIGAVVALELSLLALARFNWRSADELRRRQIKDFWAAIGFSMLAMFPILHVIGPYTTAETRLTLVYVAGITGGCLFYAWDRLGDRLPFFRHKETD